MVGKQITGILWWKPKQWDEAKQISSDSYVFDGTYQEWKESAEKMLKNFEDLGIKVYKVEIDLDELVTWCKDEKMPLDSKARSRYASIKAKEIHEAQSK